MGARLPEIQAVAARILRHTIRHMRQSFEARPGTFTSSLAYEYPAGWQVPAHSHRSDQLIYGIRGVMEVNAADTLWLVPPQSALWIPADLKHSIRMPSAVSMRTLYLRPALLRNRACGVIQVAPLLRELILEVVRRGELKIRGRLDRALFDVLKAQISGASQLPTTLSMPRDARARRLAESIIANPRASEKLDAQCRRIGVSVRTMQRAFRQDVGTDFETWRRQARILSAVPLLIGGQSIKAVSYAVGYRQAATFVAMFRRVLGATPKAWVSALQERI